MSSSHVELWALLMQISQRGVHSCIRWDGSFLSKQKSAALWSLHIFLVRGLERIQPVSLILLQLRVFRNLHAQLLHPSAGESMNLSGPYLTQGPLYSDAQHRILSHGIISSHVTVENNMHQLSSSGFQQNLRFHSDTDWLWRANPVFGSENEPDVIKLSSSWNPFFFFWIFTYLYFIFHLVYISFSLLMCLLFVGFDSLFSSLAFILHVLMNIFTFLWNITNNDQVSCMY